MAPASYIRSTKAASTNPPLSPGMGFLNFPALSTCEAAPRCRESACVDFGRYRRTQPRVGRRTYKSCRRDPNQIFGKIGVSRGSHWPSPLHAFGWLCKCYFGAPADAVRWIAFQGPASGYPLPAAGRLRVILDRCSRLYLSAHLGFAPVADQIPHRCETTLCAISGSRRLPVAARFHLAMTQHPKANWTIKLVPADALTTQFEAVS